VKRFVLAAALAVGCLMLPAAASAAVHQIFINGSSYCVAVDNGPTAVTFTERAPGGGVIRTKQATTATAGVNCATASTPGAESFTTTLDSAPGATVTADAGAGVSATFPIPYGAYDATGGVGIVKVKNLPSAAGLITINGGGASSYTGPSYTTPAPLTVGNGAITALTTVGGITYSAQFTAAQFSVNGSYYGSVSAYGGDPLGPPIAVAISGGGAPSQSAAMYTGVDDGQYNETRVPYPIVPGAVLTVTQAGWFSHTVTFASISASGGSINVSVPAVSGETANASFDLGFQTSASLGCPYLGNAAYMLTECSTTGARYAASFPAFFAAGDDASISLSEPDGDQANGEIRATGLYSYLDDGTIGGNGFVPGQPITMTATTPSHMTASVPGVTYTDGSAYFGGEDGQGYIPIKIVSGTSITASGPAAGGTPRTFVANLEMHASGTTIVGTTYPGARVAVHENRPTGSPDPVFTTADASGAFSLDVGSILPRDTLTVDAADPSGAMLSERSIFGQSSQPSIQGVADQQLVHGTVSLGALNGGPAGIFWSGDGTSAQVSDAPFTYALDTTLLKDGPHRVSAQASGDYSGRSDYLWLRVDNTAPVVASGPAQYVAIGHSAVLLPGATDANGIASLAISFGDGTTTTQPVAQIGQPVRHVYAKAGTFTEIVTATDAAGNVASASAAIHVISKLSEQVAGKIPATFKQAKKLKKRKNLSVKFTSHLAGELSVHVLNSSSKQKAVAMLTFAAVDAKATLTLASKKWPKGRYTVVLQFTDAAGSPGPVVLQPLRIR
jgi:hypothetical protein